MRSTPRALSQKGVPHHFLSGLEIFFQIKQLAGKIKEHLIKMLELLFIKSEILLYLYGKLYLYNNQTMKFPYKVSF